MRKTVFLTVILIAGLAAAQEQPPQQQQPPAQQDPWQFWVRANAQLYDNFFEAPNGRPQDDVTALFGEAGASVGFAKSFRAYGQVNYLHYDEEGLDSSPGFRVGLRGDAHPHSFDVYAEDLRNRPTFDVGDEFDRADIRTLAATYEYRSSHDWSAGADGELQQQNFKITTSRDNDFRSAGASVRWRGSRLFSPEVGVRFGNRDVDDDRLSYGQRDVYLQIRSSLTPKLYLSGRYRNRKRDYDNLGREDKRNQITLSADYTLVPNLILNLYGSHETTGVNQPNRDFKTALYVAGLTWRF